MKPYESVVEIPFLYSKAIVCMFKKDSEIMLAIEHINRQWILEKVNYYLLEGYEVCSVEYYEAACKSLKEKYGDTATAHFKYFT